ncbi:hypothetical protein [Pseudomonas antarctica]|nr:hypothetical protein [Pseudomonas antarctica]
MLVFFGFLWCDYKNSRIFFHDSYKNQVALSFCPPYPQDPQPEDDKIALNYLAAYDSQLLADCNQLRDAAFGLERLRRSLSNVLRCFFDGNPDVHGAFDALDPAEKKRVATRIVLWAVDEVGEDSKEVAQMLSCGGWARLETLCAEMDEQYFYLLERDYDGSYAWLSKAHAYSAGVFLTRDELDDVVYESTFATDKSFQVSGFL